MIAKISESLDDGRMTFRAPEDTAVDPVCGVSVDRLEAVETSDRDGKTSYFCSAKCKALFDQSPSRYVVLSK